ncbi:MAG TPA: twin-arginine translocase subunit TatB [Persephonella sp.]|nr:twin-arginine translocase subunit TatB [Hydrogenothermaceae bacterium]HIQ24764.1 twin-arginine translocase subunit TatB [Persephonella sp.]
MFGIGWTEIMVIMIVAVIVLGPKRLPEAMKQVARIFRDIKSTVDDVKNSVISEVDDIKSLPEQTKSEFEKRLTFDDDDFEKELDKEIKKEKKQSFSENYQPKREKISFSKKEEIKDA